MPSILFDYWIVLLLFSREINNIVSSEELWILFRHDFKVGHIANEIGRNKYGLRELCWWKNYSLVIWKILSGRSEFKNEPQGRSKSILSKDQLKSQGKS